ncbi:MAG: pentapeptide repeat-containing protein [Rhodococcus sp. (in: high G+C Gram-positive bacteria)]|nr:MAG: pentapeptide repeat-containing protein [Rhodococcus sp. (in: high G+C Gram-positive bacteria)]
MKHTVKSPVFWQAVVGLATAVAAITAVVISSRTLAANSEQFAAQRQQQQQQQASERFARAIDQLSSDKLETRLGAIYSLEQLAFDSPRHQPTVIEVITAYVRTHVPAGSGVCANRPVHDDVRKGNDEPNLADPAVQGTPVADDIDAAVDVLGRRAESNEDIYVDLSDTCLAEMSLYGDLSSVAFYSTDLTGTYLVQMDLTHAIFQGADLTGAYLSDSNLDGANLSLADLDHSYLDGASLREVFLDGSDLMR